MITTFTTEVSGEPGPGHSSLASIASIETKRINDGSSGKMPTTSVRRPISRLKRSSGLVLRSLGQCSAGNA